MELRELLFFAPIFKSMIWGGNRMRDVFGYDIPSENTGECWAISAHPNGDCTLLNGKDKGRTLSWLWENRRELFGGYNSERFPLLLKVIDAKTDLSIQVHPDDTYANVHENGSLGKTECWYVLDCVPGAKLVVGHNAKTREELNYLIDNHEYSELIRETPVSKGDFIQIEPGTVHAIKGGLMILETQQNSDITYRVYDYDRLMNGKPRELHVEQSKAVITVPAKKDLIMKTKESFGREELISCKYYTVEKINVDKVLTIGENAPFRLVSCVEGFGEVNGQKIKKGDHFIVPSDYGELSFDGRMTLISSVPN